MCTARVKRALARGFGREQVDEGRVKRHRQIAEAAYGQLAEHGYGGASMLRIARAAKASNETLYRWYGDKDGLFAAMVRDNAEAARALLQEALVRDEAPAETLARVAPVLLSMLLGDRAILLNRAAAADPSGRLGAAISAGGRDVVMPLLEQLMERLGGDVVPGEASGWFLGLLVGDLQVRRIIGELTEPGAEEIAARCHRALGIFNRLLGVGDEDTASSSGV
nr:TetR/AcrR family transcriptional regulator [Amaricoccus macauensis]